MMAEVLLRSYFQKMSSVGGAKLCRYKRILAVKGVKGKFNF
jgi:hypothetical protein